MDFVDTDPAACGTRYCGQYRSQILNGSFLHTKMNSICSWKCCPFHRPFFSDRNANLLLEFYPVMEFHSLMGRCDKSFWCFGVIRLNHLNRYRLQ